MQPLQRTTARRIVAALTLLAFTLRAYGLAAQSLWSDEDITLDRAGKAVADILAGLPVEQAPLYYLLMRGWALVAGTSDFALRYPSLAFGVSCVPLAAYFGTRLAGRWAGLILALIVAINPFAVYYGQEARMYTLLMAASLTAFDCALRAEETGRRRWWVASGAAAAFAVYTHYYGALAVLVLGGWALLDLARRDRENLVGWLIAGGTAALLFAPWLPHALAVLGFQGWRSDLRLADAPGANALAWSGGVTSPWDVGVWILGLYVLLAVIGTVHLLRRWRSAGAARALAALGIPLVAYVLVILRTVDAGGTADYDPRYYFAALPGLYLAVAAGVAALPRFARGIGVALLCLAAAVPLFYLHADPSFQKQDYRGFLHAVESAAGHEDTVLFLDGPSLGLAQRYEIADSPVKIVDLRSSGNRQRSDADLEARIAELADEYPHLWLAEDGVARGLAQRWLDQHGYPVTEAGFQDITLSRYHYPSGGYPPGWARRPELSIPAVDAINGPANPQILLALDIHRRVQAGDVLSMMLTWVPHVPLTRTYQVSLRLVDPTRDPATAVVTSVDRPPLNGPRLYTAWSPNEPVTARHGLLIPRDTPPQEYQLEIVLYDVETTRPVGAWSGIPITVELPREAGSE